VTEATGTNAQGSVGRVVRRQSGQYTVATDDGPVVAVLRGLLKRERQETGLVALGDFVRVSPLEAGATERSLEAVIVEVLPRKSALARRAPGPRGIWAQDVIVANMDLLVPVFSAKRPEPRLRMLDRFLAIAEIDELDSAIVLNKTDLGVSEELSSALEEYKRVGYPLVYTSAVDGTGIDELRKLLENKVSAVVGPSGVGKSSLLNAIEPGLRLGVSEISDAVQKGRHTTRVRELLTLSCGALVADTPGLREIGLWEVDPGELEWAFVEFRPHLNQCKYYDCTHVHEPGCAVRAAVEQGEISERRHDSYVRMLNADG
jgi:ribosome biogenesis GTPase